MDDTTFDGLTRRINTAVSRRTGIFGALAGFAAIATRSASARVDVPPDCRGTGTQCTDGSECCSGRCIPKADGTMRCARTASNKKKGGGGKNGNAPLQCTVCASGCPFTSIESAVAAAAPGAVVTVGPGTYTPVRDETYASTMVVTKDLTLRACDPAHRPLVLADQRSQGRALFYLSTYDGADCHDAITVVIDGFDFRGTTSSDNPGTSLLVASCDTDWTLRNSSVREFGSTPYLTFLQSPITSASIGHGLIENTVITDCVSNQGPDTAMVLTAFAGVPDLVSEVEIRDCVIADNTGQSTSLRAYSRGRIILSGSTEVRNNMSATLYSGGVYLGASNVQDPGELVIRGRATIHDNVCPAQGCGVYAESGNPVTGATARNVFDNISINDESCPDIYLDGAADPCPF